MTASSPMQPATTSPNVGFESRPTASANRLKARPVPASTFNSSAFETPSIPRPPTTNGAFGATQSFAPLQPTQSSYAPLQSTSRTPSMSEPPASSAPNYSLSLSPQPPTISVSSFQPAQPTYTPQPAQMAPPLAPAVKPPPGYSSGLMQPSKPANSWGAVNKSNGDWGDFDPLK